MSRKKAFFRSLLRRGIRLGWMGALTLVALSLVLDRYVDWATRNLRFSDPEQVPDTFVCSWQYPNFTMSFTDLRLPGDQGDAIPNNGNYFYGTRGVLQVNRGR